MKCSATFVCFAQQQFTYNRLITIRFDGAPDRRFFFISFAREQALGPILGCVFLLQKRMTYNCATMVLKQQIIFARSNDQLNDH